MILRNETSIFRNRTLLIRINRAGGYNLLELPGRIFQGLAGRLQGQPAAQPQPQNPDPAERLRRPGRHQHRVNDRHHALRAGFVQRQAENARRRRVLREEQNAQLREQGAHLHE